MKKKKYAVSVELVFESFEELEVYARDKKEAKKKAKDVISETYPELHAISMNLEVRRLD